MSKVVSIIIPIFNASKDQLVKSIGSAMRQSYSDIEVIAINDCSNNSETLEALSTLEQTYLNTGKLRIYNSEENRGIAASRNKGIEVARGDYICFLDQDDYYDPEYIYELMKLAEKEQCDIAICGFTSIDEKGIKVSSFPKEGQNIDSEWYSWATCAIWNRIYNRKFLNKYDIKFPNGCVTEDIVFLMQCNIYASRISATNKQLYYNVISQASTSHSKSFHSLDYDQMPVNEVQTIINRNLPCDPHLYAFLCNEMTLLCTVLTAGSDIRTLRKVAQKTGELVRTASKGNSIRYIKEFNDYCDDKKIMQLLILFMALSSIAHVEQLYAVVVHAILKMVK